MSYDSAGSAVSVVERIFTRPGYRATESANDRCGAVSLTGGMTGGVEYVSSET
jgi:hypothetical protein